MTTKKFRKVSARIALDYMGGLRMKESARVVFRELLEPVEVVEALRMRHRVYFEERRYGTSKTSRIDLTSHDTRSRLYGVFREERLIGGVRVVFRREQPLASMFRALRLVVDAGDEDASMQLPSEEAFDIAAQMGADHELVDVELGRLTLDGAVLSRNLSIQLIVATLAAARCGGCRLYVYSCATALSKRYARVTNPRYVFAPRAGNGIASDNFVFPKPTLAAVAAVEDSPYAGLVQSFHAQLSERGFIELSTKSPPPHSERPGWTSPSQ